MKKNTLIQLAVFIENRTGRLAEICKTLGDKGINIFGFSIADTEDYGIFRLICKRYEMAHQILKESGFTVRENEVICVKVPHQPGGLASVLNAFSKAEINVEYLYAIADTMIVFNLDHNEKGIDLLHKIGVETIRQEDL